MTRFGILGALEIDGAPAAGGPQQRALLALLLLHVNETLSRDRIVQELWPRQPPASADHAVQVYVSRLRKLLPPGAELRTEAGGYKLLAEPLSIDARLFEQRLREGRELLAAGDAAGAEQTLAAALELWRGPALLDVRFEELAQAEVARLEELRTAATEELVEARLRLGRHAEVVPEVEALVEAEPLRERLRELLMLALYRCGRQADALAVYRDAAHALREELGLEPGPELRRLEAAILRHDDDLAAPVAAAPPVRLPSPPTPLLGRDDDVEDVVTLLREEARLVTVTGPGGIGKTRLAIEVAQQVATDFDGGVFFVGLASVGDPALVVPTIARTTGAPEAVAQLDALAERLDRSRVLLVLDNLEHVADAAPALGELLSCCPGVRVLATSRRSLRLYGEHEYALRPLALDAAVSLFAARARAVRRDFDLAGGRGDAVAEICRRLDGLPLAIELAAAQSRLLEPAEVLAGLRTSLSGAGPRDVPARHQTLRATVEWSYSLLGDGDARVFRRLSVFAGGFEASAAAAVAGADAPELATQLEHSLLVRDERGRYRMLETIRMYARERLDAAGEAAQALRAHADHYASLSAEAARELERADDSSAWLERLERERANLRAALAWARTADPALELELATSLVHFWAVRGNVGEGREALEAAIARAPADAPSLARALVGAGSLARQQADFERAEPLLERGIALAHERGEWAALVMGLTNVGFVLLQRGDAAGAAGQYEQALVAARNSPNPRDRSRVLNCLADLALRHGDHERVEEISLELVPLAQAIGHPEGIGVASVNRAYGRFAAGDLAAALEHAVAALDAWAGARDGSGIAWCLTLVAGVRAADAPESAAELLGASDALLEAAGAGLSGFELEVREHAERAAAAELAEEVVAAAKARGRTWSLDEAVERCRMLVTVPVEDVA